MGWPAQSPGVNSVANSWDNLKRTAQENSPKNAKEQTKSVKDAWNEFPRERLFNSINSMPTRCKALIKARGGIVWVTSHVLVF